MSEEQHALSTIIDLTDDAAPPIVVPTTPDRVIELPPTVSEETSAGGLRAGRFYRRLGHLLAVLDALCWVAAVTLISLFLLPASSGLEVALSVGGTAVVWTLVFRGFGLHAPHLVSGPEEFRKVLSASSVGTLVAGFILENSIGPSIRAVAAMWAVALLLELVVRRVARWRVVKLRKDGRLLYRTLIVGANADAGSLAHLLRHRELGFNPLGFVATSSPATSPDGLSVVGNVEKLPDLLWEHDAECIFVASSAVATKDMLKVTQAARQGGADVRIAANVPDLFFSRLAVQSMGEITSLSLRPVRLSGAQATAKRTLDVVLTAGGLIVAAPLWALVAMAVKLDSRGPILFKQKRVTKGGRVFTMLKFRTMVEGAGDVIEEEAQDAAFFKMDDDPRLTRVGRVLRRLSLDELPQLINVLRGEMSLVGPRPLPAGQVAANLELLTPRHEVRAGITGWWQTNGRSELGPRDSVRLDLFYIENWSLALDLYIMLKTIGAVISGRGAY